jgi:hypothetical protein
MAGSTTSPNQGSLFENMGQFNHEVPGVRFGRVELGGGVYEGDFTDISMYLKFYVDAIREIGRGRSNDLGFGALYVNGQAVTEVAAQHDNPDRVEVQGVVVASRKTHMEKANYILARRAEIRQNTARSWIRKGALTEEDLNRVPLLEDVHSLEFKWYGNPTEASDEDMAKSRAQLYRWQRKNADNSGSNSRAA